MKDSNPLKTESDDDLGISDQWYNNYLKTREKVHAHPKKSSIFGNLLGFSVLGGVGYGFYAGAYIGGIILTMVGLFSLLLIIIDGKRSSGGNWTSWGAIPFVLLLIIIGLLMIIFSADGAQYFELKPLR
ncbi:hypothetical protein [Thiosulfativibrio zosterae]|uniref:Uncharacterized protein n=1 Tax=Thiosulfativibrio zosterae TaxID=2675053 RepID=A0A6F8PNU6_9GAMM|nr:hypothetical protein [Thiosulfativibrio zosterae]BBP43792.1 hypothetical protein THMIRHAT_15380 [Thiosulfativibrio zosterae]